MRYAILLLLAGLVAPALAALDVTADITTDTTWTSAQSPINLKPAATTDTDVNNGATLTI